MEKIKKFEKVIEQNKSGFLQIMVLYCMSCHDNYELLTETEKEKILGIIYTFYMKDEQKADLAAISDIVMKYYSDFLSGKMIKSDIYYYL